MSRTDHLVTRRTFLTVGATAAASLATHGAVSAARSVGPSDMVRIGVIGVGWRGSELISEIEACHRARLTVVCDVYQHRLQRVAAVYGAKAVSDWLRTIERNDVDAVVIATPNHWHARMAIAAMKAGKDVYLETPMAHTLAEAKTIRDTAASTGRCLQIGAQETSDGRWHAAGSLARSGRLGRIRWCQASERIADSFPSDDERSVTADDLDWDAWQGPATRQAFDAQRFHQWRNYWDYSGGVAADAFFHKLAPILMAIGPEFPARVSAAGGVYIDDGREAPDSFVMTAEYAAGHTVVLASSPAHASGVPAVIRGTNASIYFERGAVKVVSEDGVRVEQDWTNAIPEVPSHIDNWLQCISSRERCVCDAELGYRTMVAISMAVEAYRGGKTLVWDASADATAKSQRAGVVV